MPLIGRSVVPTSSARGFAAVAFAALAVVLSTSEASATVRFVATELSQCPYSEYSGGILCFGETITIGFRIEADAGDEVFGIGAAAFGYDDSMLNFVSGEAVDSLFHRFADPRYGAFDGLDNQAGGALENGTPTALSGANVQFLTAAATTPRTFNPLDPGLDGVIGGVGSQFRVRFRVSAPGVTTLWIGTNLVDPVLGNAVIKHGGRAEDAQNLQIEIGSDQQPRVVVPEPGSAPLVGLGLAGLAWSRNAARRGRRD